MDQILTDRPHNSQGKILHPPRWQWIILLCVLGYEGLGAMAGGILLILAPDGKYMDMPVDMMHGIFPDFLVPGIILLVLGGLNIVAFFSVLGKKATEWILTGLALGGLYIWFFVEIVILWELHWLHAMWGLPVLLGWVVTIPLIVLHHNTETMRKALLVCGILSSLWYFTINIIVPLQDPDYNSISQTVSELSAINAPTRVLWVLLVMLYPLLYAAFGWGVIQSSHENRSLRIVGYLTIIYCVMNFYWPPMHLREVIAAGGGTLTDTLHIVWAMMTLLFNMVIMGFGASALGKRFRRITLVTFVVFVLFGILIGLEAPGINANRPTPWIGVWERINIGAYMTWVIVFAITLWPYRIFKKW